MTDSKTKYPAFEKWKKQVFNNPEDAVHIDVWVKHEIEDDNLGQLISEFNQILAENERYKAALENLCQYSDVICNEGSDMCGDTYQSDELKEIFAQAIKLLTQQALKGEAGAE